MKIHPIAVNHIVIETETGQLIDVNDGGKSGLFISSADFIKEKPVVVQDDVRIVLTFEKRGIQDGKITR